MLLLTYLAVGAFAGLLAGLFGIGGGMVIVPVLVIAGLVFGRFIRRLSKETQDEQAHGAHCAAPIGPSIPKRSSEYGSRPGEAEASLISCAVCHGPAHQTGPSSATSRSAAKTSR